MSRSLSLRYADSPPYLRPFGTFSKVRLFPVSSTVNVCAGGVIDIENKYKVGHCAKRRRMIRSHDTRVAILGASFEGGLVRADT